MDRIITLHNFFSGKHFARHAMGSCTRALLCVCLVLVLVITQGRASLVTEPVEGWTARATGRAGLPLVLSKENVHNISGLDISELDLPSRDLAGSIRHRSCALVGNSGALLGGNQGRAIDSHDAVMRVNYTPIRGWEADVGSKTTYDFIAGHIARAITTGTERFREVPWRTPESTLVMYTGMIANDRGIVELYAPLQKKFPLARAHFTHSAFISRNVALWEGLKDEFEKPLSKTYHSKPMSGFYAVTFMMQLCDNLTLFGFEDHPKVRWSIRTGGW
mmetsp:Transcript_37264/g.117268  ORF Transcript_37264/g.117268 Transcript_37264/m.117268 type:complete len:276 (+) Transcript_37264:498-1325(+)